MNKLIKGIAITLIAVLSMGTTLAQNPHFRGSPSTTDNGTTLTACFDIAGLGNVSSVGVTLHYNVTINTQCTNPAGNVAPGQSKTLTNQTQSFTIPVRNGRTGNVCRTTAEPTAPTGSCPNNKWTASVTDATFTNVYLTVQGKRLNLPTPSPQ